MFFKESVAVSNWRKDTAVACSREATDDQFSYTLLPAIEKVHDQACDDRRCTALHDMITLRPDQQAAVDAIVQVKRGIVKAPAGAGKTVIAAAAIRELYDNGLRLKIAWYAHTMEQCEQARVACEQFDLVGSGFKPAIVPHFFCYQAGHSAAPYDLVILDECHHIAAEEFRKILDDQQGGRWGFSATPEREDDLRDDVFELIGPIVYTVEREGLVESGKLLGAKVYFHAPNDEGEMQDFVEGEAKKGFERMKYSLFHVAKQIATREGDPGSWKAFCEEAKIELMSRARWHAAQTYGIFENAKRNGSIVTHADNEIYLGNSVLVLVGSIAHGKELAEAIPGAVVVYSKMGAKKRKAAIAGFRDGSIKCVIATSLADEGLDVPRANVLILAAAGRSRGKAEQRTGRVLREFAEQTHGIIHDFWDWQHPLLMNQSRARAKVYAGLKYDFVGGNAVQIALRGIGVKIHSLLSVPVLAEPSRYTVTTPVTGLDNHDGDERARESTVTVNDTSEATEESRGGQKLSVIPIPREGTINNGMQFRNGAWREIIYEKTGCGLLQPELDSGSSEPTADKPPLSTKPKKRKRKEPKERKHARLSPSTLKAKAICPGFINDPDGDKKAANRGTLGHKAVETDNPVLSGDDVQLRHAIEKCMKYRDQVIHLTQQEVFASLPKDERKGVPGYTRVQEIRFEYFEQWGFCDEVVIFRGDRGVMFDWKFAYNFYEVDAPQFWAYCLGAWNKWPQLETIDVHVGHPFLDTIDVKTFTRAEHFADFQVKIKGVMAQAEINDPAHYRVTAQCAYCGFAGKCRKLAEVGVAIGKRYAVDLEIPDISFHGSEVSDPKTMAALLRLAPVVLKAASGWKKAGMEMWNNGTTIPGFKEVRKAGNRAVESAVAAYKIVKNFFAKDMKPEDFLAHCDVTVSGLEKLVSDATPTGNKARAVLELGARLEDADILSTGVGGMYLLPEKGKSDDE